MATPNSIALVSRSFEASLGRPQSEYISSQRSDRRTNLLGDVPLPPSVSTSSNLSEDCFDPSDPYSIYG